ncbi:MAG: nucleoside kinase [Anaerofustis stercorihominis]|nr:nucleoside kinase [Anaerofustis stercorihominis]
MKQIKINGKDTFVEDSASVREIVGNTGDKLCAVFADNVIESLEYIPEAGQNIIPCTKSHPAGARIYENTLSLIFAKAAINSFPDRQVSILFSIAGGLYCRFKDGTSMSDEDVRRIKESMQKIIAEDQKIVLRKMTEENACTLNSVMELLSSGNLFKYMEDDISLYELDGFYGYFYTKLLGSSADIDYFDLIPYEDGCVLLASKESSDNVYMKLERQQALFNELLSYDEWCRNFDVSDAVSVNEKVLDGSVTELITIAETRHEQVLQRAASEIYADRENKRVVLIAGPSSAGKTTTSKRLRAHLTAMGLHPITIAMDDYFIDRDKTPLDEFGKPDFEGIEAINIELFNENLIDLMDGKETVLPIYDFKTGKSIREGRTLSVEAGSPIIIEGIHGLNESLTSHIPKKNKYKIYINDLTHLNIDQYNRIPTSDVRLVRRIVRDSVQRGHSALDTISMWQSVRRGEEKNIFPYAHEADIIFNSSLFYEMGVLKKYAVEALSEVPRENEFFYEAQRILKYLSFFVPIEDESAIFTDSVLREFIGGSVFEHI